jgi:hypothetical protein
MKPATWFRKVRLSEAEKADRDYYASMSPERRLEIVQELREIADRLGYEDPKRLRRVLRVVKQARS